ncbi:cyclic nucleotide-binding domain-containing protein [Spirochaeta isovalerica]|uniref:CRP-like cAMP-binding protein n=1 Tax=Spirochaeta isovalerica TaxID=150 RepID=A0A841R692_9SPIO|nr:cyclic nucleotide-binding domain-containing protein [Spirochaeta isovalerica]MBB6478570.1 CRP-like cAMP-binding protein [Spirochaeta isovalerica]
MKEISLNSELKSKIEQILTFRFLTTEELDELIKVSSFQYYGTDEKIIVQGEVNQAIYAIISGNVKVTVREREETEAYISTIGSGEVFGEAGIFTEVKRTANVTCTEETLLLEISRKGLIDFIRNHPRAGNKILMLIIYSLLKKLREVNRELAYERKADADQDDIDSIIRNFMD